MAWLERRPGWIAGSGPVQGQQAARVHGSTQLTDGHPAGQVRGRRREDVPPVEGAGDLRQAEARILQEVRARDAAEACRGRHEQTVVRPHEGVAAQRLDSDAQAGRAHTRIHHGDVGPDGQVGHRAPEKQGAVTDGEAVDPVGQVDDDGRGADAGDHGPHDAGRGVAQAEVAEQADEGPVESGRGPRGGGRGDGVRVDAGHAAPMVRGTTPVVTALCCPGR